MKNLFSFKDKRAKILVIDDEEDICAYLKSILQKSGKFEVWTSTHPIEGIALAKTVHPDLVLLDIMMPQMDGTEVAQRLHNDQATKDIIIVFSSVLAQEEDLKENAGIIGGYPFIAKPIVKEELIARLESLLLEALAAK